MREEKERERENGKKTRRSVRKKRRKGEQKCPRQNREKGYKGESRSEKKEVVGGGVVTPGNGHMLLCGTGKGCR